MFGNDISISLVAGRVGGDWYFTVRDNKIPISESLTRMQTMMAVAGTPWAIKGALGVLSDAYPLFGWHKSSYIIMVSPR